MSTSILTTVIKLKEGEVDKGSLPYIMLPPSLMSHSEQGGSGRGGDGGDRLLRLVVVLPARVDCARESVTSPLLVIPRAVAVVRTPTFAPESPRLPPL
jgi:hypothetical protein